jgi:hypothetical protein
MRCLATLIKAYRMVGLPEGLPPVVSEPLRRLCEGQTGQVPPVLVDDLIEEEMEDGIPLVLPWNACLFDWTEANNQTAGVSYADGTHPESTPGGVYGTLAVTDADSIWFLCFFVPHRDYGWSGEFAVGMGLVSMRLTGEEPKQALGVPKLHHIPDGSPPWIPLANDDQAGMGDLGIWFHGWVRVAAVAMQRFACSNVEAIPQVRLEPQRRRKKNGKGPRGLAYRVLVVKTPNGPRRLYPRLRRGEDAASVRFHTRRGGYRDYTKGRGLFGKIRKRIWFQPHVRGDKSKGEIRKAYRLAKSDDADAAK